MAMSSAVTIDSLKYYLTAGAVAARPTAWTVSLHSGPPGVAGTANELAYAGYGRQPATFSVDSTDPSAPSAANSADLTYPAADADYTVTHMVVWGNAAPQVIQALNNAKTISSGVAAVLAAGELVIGGKI